jgi:hypothetical protein
MSEIKKVGLFGSLSNGVKATSASIEVIAASINEAASLGLLKIQQEAIESSVEAGLLNPQEGKTAAEKFAAYRQLKEESLMAARLSYK